MWTTLQNFLQFWNPRIYCTYEKFRSESHSGLLIFVTHFLTNATKNFQLMATTVFSNSAHFTLVQHRCHAYLCKRSNIIKFLPLSFAARVEQPCQCFSYTHFKRTLRSAVVVIFSVYIWGLKTTHKRKFIWAIYRQMFHSKSHKWTNKIWVVWKFCQQKMASILPAT